MSIGYFLCDFQSMIDRAVSELFSNSFICLWDKEDKFIEKIKQGIVFYEKPKNMFDLEYKKPRYDKRIASKRVFTHTKK